MEKIFISNEKKKEKEKTRRRERNEPLDSESTTDFGVFVVFATSGP